MNYRHDYHAGNFADVLKHVVLARILTYMKLKEAPFRVVDTHAGAGLYDLSGAEAEKTGEWREGIGRLLNAELSHDVAELIEPYLETVRAVNPADGLIRYPGSPLIARHLMRRGDVLAANELRGDDFERLKLSLSRVKDTVLLNIDGWHAIKSLLPPKERRGIVLIDPPFEDRNEFTTVAHAISEALARFANGVFVVWYPVKDVVSADRLIAQISACSRGNLLDVRLKICEPFAGLGLTETGVAIINPPYTLADELKRILPELQRLLGEGNGSGFTIRSEKT